MPRPKVAFYWCASCGGCEETVVDLAEDILGVVAQVDIVLWPVALDFKYHHLEALADGCRVVTTPAPGPYAALPLLAAGLGWVVPAHGLRAALRAALDDGDAGYGERALAAIAPFRRDAVDSIVAAELLPALLKRG